PPPPTLSLHDALPIYARGQPGQHHIERLSADARDESGDLRPSPAGRPEVEPFGGRGDELVPVRRVGGDAVERLAAQSVGVGGGQDRKSTRLNSSHRTI